MSDETFESRETTPETSEQTEQKEKPALEDSTVNPGTRVEQTQTFNTAEAIEEALTTSINNTLVEAAASSAPADDGSELMMEAEGGPAVPSGDVGATPINLPNPVVETAENSPAVPSGDVGATPINLPNPVEETAESSPVVPRGDVGATPINLPNPVEETADSSPVVPRGDVGATPINLPNPVEGQVEGGPVVPSGDAGATPINLPNPVESQIEADIVDRAVISEMPDPGTNPEPPNMEIAAEGSVSIRAGAGEAALDDWEAPTVMPADLEISTETEVSGGQQTERFAEDDWEAPNAIPVDLGREAVGIENLEPSPETGSENMESEQAPPAEELPEEDAEETEETPAESGGEADETKKAGSCYMHEDDEGNITVVDENGKPIDSPPIVMKFKGKYYAFYEGDTPPIKEDGTITDPSKLAEYEISSYSTTKKGMQVYQGEDGKTVVVDENGKPVDSPPAVVYYKGKYYAVYPGDDLPIKEDGTVSDAAKLAQYEIASYKPPVDGMKIYFGEGGKTVVVDENGKPVDSPPSIVKDSNTGKYYFVNETDPSKLKDLQSGNFASALAQGLITEAPDYEPSPDGKKIYFGEDGKTVVVDETGKPVDSPPSVVQDPNTGKYYFVTESDPAKLKDLTMGNFASALAQGVITEASDYEPSPDGKKIYFGEGGKIVVVDETGKPVDCPPSVVKDPNTGKYYFVTETDPGKLKDLTMGNFASALAQGVITEAPDYKPPWWNK